MPSAFQRAPAATDTGASATAGRRPGAWRRAGAPLAGLLGAPLLTVAAHAQAAPPAVEGPSFLPMAMALILVLGMIGAALWVLRRTGLAPRGGSSQLRVVTQLALGPRERVVIVEVGERWWLLGVGAGGITRLGSVPKGEASTAPIPAASFSALLDRLRGGAR